MLMNSELLQQANARAERLGEKGLLVFGSASLAWTTSQAGDYTRAIMTSASRPSTNFWLRWTALIQTKG